MKAGELLAFICYFLLMIAIGVIFMVRDKKNASEAGYFLGGRSKRYRDL